MNSWFNGCHIIDFECSIGLGILLVRRGDAYGSRDAHMGISWVLLFVFIRLYHCGIQSSNTGLLRTLHLCGVFGIG